ncbi:hypothetical protein CHU33_12740 [Superficieibacter electus]|uniref:Uncharacterized protein n=1 Tax=Superficieibacter electus TaxID=2022662 RepID=A0ABX4ZCX8_9ENTR|nr:hypothetical protein [Superficieibacter electus]POP44320.1 hypothetical protein CHU33_12740 [Superficieibacter electus]
MAENGDNLTTRTLLTHSLASWKFFMPLGALPLLWAMIKLPAGGLQILFILNAAYIAFGCWRLWLDEGYFRVIGQDNLAECGKMLAFVWQRERLSTLTLTEREQGARRQLHLTLKATMLAWMLWLLALVISI